MIFGIDLGVRSFYAVALNEEEGLEGTGNTFKFEMAKGQTRYAELRGIQQHLQELVLPDDVVIVEEPPLAGPMNKRTFGQLSMTCGAILSATPAQSYVVPVSTWKKVVVGNGSASKGDVESWLRLRHPALHDQCGGDQNLVDAACIALYGSSLTATAGRLAAGSGDLADPS